MILWKLLWKSLGMKLLFIFEQTLSSFIYSLLNITFYILFYKMIWCFRARVKQSFVPPPLLLKCHRVQNTQKVMGVSVPYFPSRHFWHLALGPTWFGFTCTLRDCTNITSALFAGGVVTNSVGVVNFNFFGMARLGALRIFKNKKSNLHLFVSSSCSSSKSYRGNVRAVPRCTIHHRIKSLKICFKCYFYYQIGRFLYSIPHLNDDSVKLRGL